MRKVDLDVVDRVLHEKWILLRDADAFAELVSRHGDMVYTACLRTLKNSADAEEAAQECFLELAQARITPSVSLAGWLYRVAVRKSLTRIRAESRRRAREERYVAESQWESAPQRQEAQEHLDEALSALPARFRDVLVLRFFEGHTFDSLGRALGIPCSTAHYRVDTALGKLRAILRRRGIEVSASALLVILTSQKASAAPLSLVTSTRLLAARGYDLPRLPLLPKLVLMGGSVVSKSKLVMLGVLSLLILIGVVAPFSPLSPWRNGTKTVSSQVETSDLAAAHAVASEEGAENSASNSGTPTRPAGAAHVPAVFTGVGDAVGSDKEPDTGPNDDELIEAASVDGTVWADINQPVSGATIRLEVMRPDGLVCKAYSTTTDSSGNYTVHDVKTSGCGLLSASAPGYKTSMRTFNALTSGERRVGQDFQLTPGENLIRGTVVDDAGNPVSNARITLINTGYSEPGVVNQTRTFDALALTFSEADGDFELFAPMPGLSDLKVTKEGYLPQVFVGIATGTDDARLVLSSDTAQLTGSVRQIDGSPVPQRQVLVQAFAEAGGHEGAQRFLIQAFVSSTDESGLFSFDGLNPKLVYRVSVPSTNGADQYLRAAAGSSTPIVDAVAARDNLRLKSGEATTVDLTLQSLARVTGTVTDITTGRPLSNMNVILSGDADVAARTAKTDPDGAYEITVGLQEPKSLNIAAYYKHNNGTLPARPSGHEQTIELAPGQSRQVPLSIESPITIPVRVVGEDGSPLQGVCVGIGEEQGESSRNYSWPDVAVTDAQGRCQWGQGAPGMRYFAWAVPQEQRGATWDQTYFSKVLAVSATVRGTSGEALPELVLVVEAKGGVEGQILDPAGAPIANTLVLITAVAATGEESNAKQITDTNGSFSVPRLAAPGIWPSIRIRSIGTIPLYTGIVRNVDLQRGMLTNVGALPLLPSSDDPAGEFPQSSQR